MNWLASWWMGLARYRGRKIEPEPREHVHFSKGFADWQRVRRRIAELYGLIK